jgi:hypothetical protein
VRSSHGHFVKTSGLRWLSLAVMLPIPFAGQRWALPFLTVLAPSARWSEAQGRRHKALVMLSFGRVIRKLSDGSDGGYGVALNAAHGTEEHPSVAPSHDRPLGQQDWGSLVHRGREPSGATMSLLWGRLRAAA